MNIISLGKCLNEYQKKWMIVIGAGNTYHACHGVDIRDTGKKANREWLDIILNDSLRLGTLVASDMVGEVVSAEDKWHKDLVISQAAKVLLKEVCSFDEQLVSLMADGDSNIEPLKSEVPKAVNVAINKPDPKSTLFYAESNPTYFTRGGGDI